MSMSPAHAPTTGNASDAMQVEQVALDYVLSWYDGDVTRAKRALHPELVKRMFERNDAGAIVLDQMGALELLNRIDARSGRNLARGRATVTVFDVFQDVATCRVDAETWIDYLQLVRIDDGWKIVNVLWEMRAQ